VRKISTRISGNWLVLTHLEGCTWRLQVWGDTPLEAEVTAVDETAAKESAVAATIDRLNLSSTRKPRRRPAWNTVITRRWDSRC
jgi:hypothetical protein